MVGPRFEDVDDAADQVFCGQPNGNRGQTRREHQVARFGVELTQSPSCKAFCDSEFAVEGVCERNTRPSDGIGETREVLGVFERANLVHAPAVESQLAGESGDRARRKIPGHESDGYQTLPRLG
ncbi:MAG: hypothetical protein ACKOI2_03935 [Actinomycetota bacterium]